MNSNQFLAFKPSQINRDCQIVLRNGLDSFGILSKSSYLIA